MCCEVCPDYYDCEIEGKLKKNCCVECPDYEECMDEVKEDYNIEEDFEENFDEDF